MKITAINAWRLSATNGTTRATWNSAAASSVAAAKAISASRRKRPVFSSESGTSQWSVESGGLLFLLRLAPGLVILLWRVLVLFAQVVEARSLRRIGAAGRDARHHALAHAGSGPTPATSRHERRAAAAGQEAAHLVSDALPHFLAHGADQPIDVTGDDLRQPRLVAIEAGTARAAPGARGALRGDGSARPTRSTSTTLCHLRVPPNWSDLHNTGGTAMQRSIIRSRFERIVNEYHRAPQAPERVAEQ